MTSADSVWDDVVGQGQTVDRLRAAAASPVHAYLFVGPPGSTKLDAARAFATVLLTGSDAPHDRDARLIRQGEHPDVTEVRRAGASILAEQVAFLGGEPATTVPTADGSTDAVTALKADLELETNQLERYRQRVAQANDAGLPDVAEALRPLLTQTQEHVRDLHTALDR